MSLISGLSNQIDQEGKLLRELNDSVLCLQAQALDDLELLGISSDRVENASIVLKNFLTELKGALEKPSYDTTISMLIENMLHKSDNTADDWKNDIQDLIDSIDGKKLSDNINLLQAVEDILNLLHADYSEAVKALYYRHR